MALKEIGHPQYFTAGVAAVCLVTLGACVQHFLNTNFPALQGMEAQFVRLLPNTGDALSNAVVVSPYKSVQLISFAESAGIALLLAATLPGLFNLPLKFNHCLRTAVMKRVGAFDAVDQINSQSTDCGIPLAFTLKTRKVYIGYSLETSALPDADRKWLMLFPVLSGYRNEQSRLDLQTNYTQTYGEMQEESAEELYHTINQFRIVLSMPEVVSIQTFNIDLYYQRFLKTHEDVKTTAEVSEVEAHNAEVTKGAHEVEASDDTNHSMTDEPDITAIWGEALHPPSTLTAEERARFRLYQWSYVGAALAIILLVYDGAPAALLLALSQLCAAMSCHPDAKRLPFLRSRSQS